jgi:C-terminal processing protease CtpA/Prc
LQNAGGKLQQIYFLIGRNTASASEMVINGLKPFINCVLIGDTTVGKNVGSILINDEENKKNQWAIMPIILKYFNKDHQSDFTNGFAPDFRIRDDFAYPLGDTRDALLAKAIEQITGIQQQAPQSSRISAKKHPIYGNGLRLIKRGLIFDNKNNP